MRFDHSHFARRAIAFLLCLITLLPAIALADKYNFGSMQRGDTFFFGSCEQDNNKDNGFEPIEWIVLDTFSDRILVISRYCLSGMSYYNPSGVKYKYTTYETSDVRAFLNDTFYKRAFTKSERKYIALTHNRNKDNPVYGIDGGKDTNDRIFLLSHEECDYYFDSNNMRRGVATPYCKASLKKANGQKTTGKYVYWWLRTPGKFRCNAEYVFDSGRIYSYGSDVGHNVVALRPAMMLYKNPSKTTGAWTNPNFR